MEIPELIEKLNRKIEKFNSVLNEVEAGETVGKTVINISGDDAAFVMGPQGPSGTRCGMPTKDRIEFFNFAIEFFDQFRNFHQNFSEFSKFSAILTEFGYFGARSRNNSNSDKISPQFRREIAVFVRKL